MLVFLTMLAGCDQSADSSKQGETPHTQQSSTAAPSLTVKPDEIFLEVEATASLSAAEELVVVNAGTESVVLEPPHIDKIDGADVSVDFTDGNSVEPGESLTVRVEVEAHSVGSHQTSLLLSSGGVALVDVPIRVSVYGPVAKLDGSATVSSPYGCSEVWIGELSNTGNRTLSVSEVEATGDGEAIEVSSESLALAPGDAASLSLSLPSTWPDESNLFLQVTTNDPFQPMMVFTVDVDRSANHVMDTVVYAGDQIDIFVATEPTGIGSMDDIISSLRTQIPDIAQLLTDSPFKIRLALNNGPLGEFEWTEVGSDATELSSTIEGWFRGATEGKYAENPLHLTYLALEADDKFHRPDAHLIPVLLNDEDNPNPLTDEEYVTAWESHVTPPAILTVHGMAGDVPDGCSSADPGTHIYNVVSVTEGVFHSICSLDFTGFFETILGEQWLKGRQVELSDSPLDGTLTVSVEGNILTDWVYADGTISIGSDVAIVQGNEIEADYYTDHDCK